MAHTAPQGYGSNYAAILDLIRFGYGIWTPSQMAALHFHAERSTAVGRDADQHSEDQSTTGVYSTSQLRWVRGPSGLSKTTWHRVNGELEQTERRPKGVLRKTRRTNRFGKDDATEYSLDWAAIREAIEHWKAEARSLKDGWWEAWAVSQIGRVTLPIQESQSPKLGETQVEGQGARMPVSQIGRHSQTDFRLSQSVGHSPPAREAQHPSAAAVALAIEQASGERPRTDGLIDKILNVAKKLDLPDEVVVRWIHDKCFDIRARGYTLSAGLLGKAAGEDLIPWIRKNQTFVSECRRRRELARQAGGELKQTPAAAGEQPQADPEFARELMQRIAAGRKQR